MRPHRQQPPSLGFSRQNTGVACHFLLQCMKVKSESEDAQSCLTPIRLLCPWDLPGKSTGVGCHRLLWTVTKRYTQTQNRVKLVLTPNTYLTHFSYFSPLLPFLSNVSEAPDKEIFWRFQIDFILCLCSENKIMRRKLQSLFRISLTFPKMLIEVKSWISPVFCITAS